MIKRDSFDGGIVGFFAKDTGVKEEKTFQGYREDGNVKRKRARRRHFGAPLKQIYQ